MCYNLLAHLFALYVDETWSFDGWFHYAPSDYYSMFGILSYDLSLLILLEMMYGVISLQIFGK
jgi:hypothetical protein